MKNLKLSIYLIGVIVLLGLVSTQSLFSMEFFGEDQKKHLSNEEKEKETNLRLAGLMASCVNGSSEKFLPAEIRVCINKYVMGELKEEVQNLADLYGHLNRKNIGKGDDGLSTYLADKGEPKYSQHLMALCVRAGYYGKKHEYETRVKLFVVNLLNGNVIKPMHVGEKEDDFVLLGVERMLCEDENDTKYIDPTVLVDFEFVDGSNILKTSVAKNKKRQRARYFQVEETVKEVDEDEVENLKAGMDKEEKGEFLALRDRFEVFDEDEDDGVILYDNYAGKELLKIYKKQGNCELAFALYHTLKLAGEKKRCAVKQREKLEDNIVLTALYTKNLDGDKYDKLCSLFNAS